MQCISPNRKGDSWVRTPTPFSLNVLSESTWAHTILASGQPSLPKGQRLSSPRPQTTCPLSCLSSCSVPNSLFDQHPSFLYKLRILYFFIKNLTSDEFVSIDRTYAGSPEKTHIAPVIFSPQGELVLQKTPCLWPLISAPNRSSQGDEPMQWLLVPWCILSPHDVFLYKRIWNRQLDHIR